MAHLGEFGRARAEYLGESDTFTFHGEEFEVPAGISVVVLMDFVADTDACTKAREDAIAAKERAEKARESAVTDAGIAAAEEAVAKAETSLVAASNELLTVMRAYVRGCLPDDAAWRRFNATARRNAVDLDELMEVCAAIFSAVAARPTRRPSDSSDGPSAGGDGSTDGSASPEETTGQSRPLEGSVVAIRDRSSRPDLDVETIPVSRLLQGSGA